MAALLLLLVLSSSELGVAATSATSPVEELAKRFRSLLAQYALGSISYDDAANTLRELANCTQRSGLGGAALEAAALLEANVSLEAKRQALDKLLDAMVSSPPPTGCSSSLLYRAYLVASLDPTPLGLGVVDPAKTIQRLAAILGSILRHASANERVEAIVFTYYPKRIARGMDVYAAIYGMALTAALAGRPDHMYWSRVLLLDKASLELIAALLDPRAAPPSIARRMLSIILPSYSPSEPEAIVKALNESLASRDYVRAAALVSLSVAAYPARSRLLNRIIQLGSATVALQGLGALSPTVLGYIASHGTAPLRVTASTTATNCTGLLTCISRIDEYIVLAAVPLDTRVDLLIRGHRLLPETDPFDKLASDILSAGYDPLRWSTVAGEASAAIALAPGYATTVTIATLLADPFAPLDPWVLGLLQGVPGTSEAMKLLSRKGLGALLNYSLSSPHPWPGVIAIAALNTYEKGLLGAINASDAAIIARRASIRPGSDPMRYAILSVAYSEALDAAKRYRGDYAGLARWLGYYTRYASIRVFAGSLVIDYAYAQGLARLLEQEVPEIHRALAVLEKRNPVLAYWARGLIEAPYPVNTGVIVKQGLGGLEEAAAKLRRAAGSPEYANVSTTLSKEAEAIERVATSVETGNLPEAVVLAKRIRETIEAGGQEARLLKKALGEQGLAELMRSLEQVETLGGQEAAKIAAAKQALEELAKSLEKQGQGRLAEELRELARSLGEGNVSAARAAAEKIASEKNPPSIAKGLVERLRRLLREKQEPGLVDIASAVLASEASGAGGGPGIGAEEILRLIREGRLGEAAKQLENMTRSNPEAAARALQELSKSGVNVSKILGYLGPGAVNKLIHSVLRSQQGQEQVITVPGEHGGVERLRAGKENTTRVTAPRVRPPRLGSGGLAVAAGLLVLAITAVLLWLGSRPERVAMLRRAVEPLVSAARRRRSSGGEEGLRATMVREFARLLAAAQELYGPRGPSETHREYAKRLPRRARRDYMDAALAYEEAKFSSHGVSREHLERIRRAASKLLGRG